MKKEKQPITKEAVSLGVHPHFSSLTGCQGPESKTGDLQSPLKYPMQHEELPSRKASETGNRELLKDCAVRRSLSQCESLVRHARRL